MSIRKAGSGLAAITLLAGCGVGVTAGNQANVKPPNTASVLEARSTQGLLAGFDRIHKAIFDRLDTNKDGGIDEYEAAPAFSLDRFAKADLNLTGKVEYRELVMYATDNGWKGWFPGYGKYDTAEKFASRFRGYLADRFDRLDANDDGSLKNYELSNADLSRTDLGLSYSELRVTARVSAVSDDEFKGADKTGDGKLSPGEFEDLFMDLVVKALGAPAKK
jgi:Ca2+-binding EF-hand superfamily protein